jgi:hypothetical protein
VRLLIFSGGTRISAGLVVAFAVNVDFFNKQDKLQVLWWRLGQGSTKTVFWNFCWRNASADLAGKITYKFAKLSHNRKLLSSKEIH